MTLSGNLGPLIEQHAAARFPPSDHHRSKHGCDVEALAEAAGMPSQSLYRILGSLRDPQLATLERILAACGMRLAIVEAEPQPREETP